MTSITPRNLNDGVQKLLRIRAAENGRSMKTEARLILGDAFGQESGDREAMTPNRYFSGPTRGFDLKLLPFGCSSEPSSFDRTLAKIKLAMFDPESAYLPPD